MNAFRYSIQSDSWVKIPPLLNPRYNHSSCTVGTTIYVIGGKVDSSVHIHPPMIERLVDADKKFKPDSGSWEMLETNYRFVSFPLVVPIAN